MKNITVKYDIVPEKEMRHTVRAGFMHFCLLAQYAKLSNAEKMPDAARKKADSSFTLLCEYASAPEKYLAREYTESAWKQRRIAAGPVPDCVYNPYYWDTPPDSIVYKPMLDLPVSDGVLQNYHLFCYYTRMWEYAHTSDSVKERRHTIEYANKVIDIVSKVATATKNLRMR